MEPKFVTISIFLFFPSLSIAGNVNGIDLCELEKEPGSCTSVINRYYFNQYSRRCERFVYTGCGGNSNNFQYEFECERTCPGDLYIGDVCSLPKKVGPCRAAMPRYYFNKETGRCEKFTYGGCSGNYNNFETKEQCDSYCFQDKPRYYPRDIEICDLDPDRGNCDSSLGRYYFNRNTWKCERFTYSGCGGNRNNFAYLFECERSCPGDIDLGDICSLDPEPGIPGTNMTCLALIPRYYFNKGSGKCEEFTFGGCGGSYNNFKTMEECKRFCTMGPPPS